MPIKDRNEKQGILEHQCITISMVLDQIINFYSIGHIEYKIDQKSIKMVFLNITYHKWQQFPINHSCQQQFLCDLNRKTAKNNRIIINQYSHMLKSSSTAVFLCLLLSIASCMVFQETSSADAPSGLGFGNQSGAVITSDYLNYFTNFINSASSFYPNNITQRHVYIGTKMNETYPAGYQGFSIIEDGNTTNNDWAIRTYGYYASLASGVDKINPDRSYFFHRYYYISQRLFLHKVGDKGKDFNPTAEKKITDAILNAEAGSTSCQCKKNANAHQVFDALINDYGYLNTFCSDSSSLAASVFAQGTMGIYLKPKYCYYVVYVSV